ncbi:hypothetical protein [Enterococcus florum]|uniref:hypothetical protein n=1 Tax=Enterococcus florum TaxID=2480627 RepID=UPI0011BA94AB|nr:hypothetical protein [Enterococcus florum]
MNRIQIGSAGRFLVKLFVVHGVLLVYGCLNPVLAAKISKRSISSVNNGISVAAAASVTKGSILSVNENSSVKCCSRGEKQNQIPQIQKSLFNFCDISGTINVSTKRHYLFFMCNEQLNTSGRM